jgi:hypothetical protein
MSQEIAGTLKLSGQNINTLKILETPESVRITVASTSRSGKRSPKMKLASVASKVAFVVVLVAAVCFAADGPTVTVKGYVLDSACAFTKGLSKPISKQCAVSCANAGSPLVILADDGTIY